MSHFTVTVALSGVIDNEKDALQQALGVALAPFDENKEVNPYISKTRSQMMEDKRFKKYLEESGQTYEQAAVEWAGGHLDCDGNVMSTYNPESQFDWWVVGGRWGGYWTLKEGGEQGALSTEESAFGMARTAGRDLATDCARISEIAAESIRPTFAFITPDGKWHEKGRMGWFGTSSDEMEQADWDKAYGEWIVSLPKDTYIIMCDFHI